MEPTPPTIRRSSDDLHARRWTPMLMVLLLGARTAVAAPTGEAPPSIKPRVLPPAAASALAAGGGVTVLAPGPHRSRCGAPVRVSVHVRNDTNRFWSGSAQLTVAGGATGPVLALSGIEPGRSVSTTVLGAPLRCQGPLVSQTLRVFAGASPTPGAPPLFEKTFQPKGFDAQKDLLASPPPNRLALQTVRFFGSCGGSVTALATFWSPPAGGAPSYATAKLLFGTAGNGTTITTKAPAQLQAALNVPGPIDCGAATGIASLSYAVEGDERAAGTVDVTDVIYE